MSIKKLLRSSFIVAFTLFLACYSFYEDIHLFSACHPFLATSVQEHKSPVFQKKGNGGKVRDICLLRQVSNNPSLIRSLLGCGLGVRSSEDPFPRPFLNAAVIFPSREVLRKFYWGFLLHWQAGLIKHLWQRNNFLEHVWKFHGNNSG